MAPTSKKAVPRPKFSEKQAGKKAVKRTSWAGRGERTGFTDAIRRFQGFRFANEKIENLRFVITTREDKGPMRLIPLSQGG